MATYFHTTDAVPEILFEGFRDGEGSYMLAETTLRGVFISDVPLDVNEGAKGEDVFEVVLPDDIDLADYELVEDLKPYREWCIPAELLNTHGKVRLLTPEEAAECNDRWLQARRLGLN